MMWIVKVLMVATQEAGGRTELSKSKPPSYCKSGVKPANQERTSKTSA